MTVGILAKELIDKKVGGHSPDPILFDPVHRYQVCAKSHRRLKG
jgi:hypothetical protein